MGRKKIKRPKRGSRPRETQFKVRLTRSEAMELMQMGADGLDHAERRLQMIRPELSAEARKEVAWRCADPQARGGMQTGADPEMGDYVDVAVTTANR